jgi:hypothetical protein
MVVLKKILLLSVYRVFFNILTLFAACSREGGERSKDRVSNIKLRLTLSKSFAGGHGHH